MEYSGILDKAVTALYLCKVQCSCVQCHCRAAQSWCGLSCPIQRHSPLPTGCTAHCIHTVQCTLYVHCMFTAHFMYTAHYMKTVECTLFFTVRTVQWTLHTVQCKLYFYCTLHVHCTLYVNCTLYPYKDERRDIRSNIPLCLNELPRAKPEGTPEGKGVYLTVYPESSLDMDSISF